MLDALFKPASEQMKGVIGVLVNATANVTREAPLDWQEVRDALERLEEHVEDIDKVRARRRGEG